jgi:ABC-type multidrug transport system fused ATPase/permease subunit
MQSNNLLFRSNNALAAKRELASPLSESMGVIVLSMVLWFGGKLIFSKEASLSPESFIVFIVLFSQIITPFKNLSTSFFNIKKGTAALDRIETLLSAPNSLTDAADAKPIAQFEHAIEFKQVSFQYGDQVVLSDINLSIPKGQSFGLVGNNGAGKTTFFSLLLDLIQPTTGEIINNEILVHTSENWKPFTASFLDESFLIGYLTPEEYFYFIGDLCGQNKADVDALLA